MTLRETTLKVPEKADKEPNKHQEYAGQNGEADILQSREILLAVADPATGRFEVDVEVLVHEGTVAMGQLEEVRHSETQLEVFPADQLLNLVLENAIMEVARGGVVLISAAPCGKFVKAATR
ncbi:hypothetical protein PG997_007961 [Apiospora hydei]|uniref:Uncharacterized protein n=1 Tax=Apiospora hydei TaxID=1337664 RepID=A0ABR1W9H7_9PEZI